MSEPLPALLEMLLGPLRERPPARCLLIGPSDQRLHARLSETLPGTAFDVRDPPGAPEAQTARYPLALLAGALERLESGAARELLSRLRDVVAEHVVVVVDLSRSPLTEDDLRALGFRRHARHGDHALFSFDLYDYKDRPEWLNPRHWAHPELWDKYRW